MSRAKNTKVRASKKGGDAAGKKRAVSAKSCFDDAFARAGKRIHNCAQGLRETPEDAEALHQYRISLRVARSLVKFARPYQKWEQQVALSTVLKELQEPTSRMREHDMLVKHVCQLEGVPVEKLTGYRSASNTAVERAAAESDVLAACRAAQEAERKAFLAEFNSKGTAKKIARVEKALGKIAWRDGYRERGLRRKAVRARVEAERESCEEALRTVSAHDIEAVHNVRKRAKAVRYIARELAGCLPADSAKTSQDMKAVQDKLGDMLDARVNAQLLREICGDAAKEQTEIFERRAQEIADEIG